MYHSTERVEIAGKRVGGTDLSDHRNTCSTKFYVFNDWQTKINHTAAQ